MHIAHGGSAQARPSSRILADTECKDSGRFSAMRRRGTLTEGPLIGAERTRNLSTALRDRLVDVREWKILTAARVGRGIAADPRRDLPATSGPARVVAPRVVNRFSRTIQAKAALARLEARDQK